MMSKIRSSRLISKRQLVCLVAVGTCFVVKIHH